MARCVHCDAYTAHPMQFNNGGPLCANCHQTKVAFAIRQARAMGIEPKGSTMKNGEFRRIANPASPWTKQWEMQGTARNPYVVSWKPTPSGGTTEEGWACACPNFTQHSPRTECKHILKIMLAEKRTTTNQTLLGVITGDKVTLRDGRTVSGADPVDPAEETRRRFR